MYDLHCLMIIAFMNFKFDKVSTDKEIVYLYVIEGTKIVIGCLVAEEVFICTYRYIIGIFLKFQ
jgi:hypothetical protein